MSCVHVNMLLNVDRYSTNIFCKAFIEGVCQPCSASFKNMKEHIHTTQLIIMIEWKMLMS